MRRAHAILAALALSLATATPALAGMHASTTRVRLDLPADVSNRATAHPRPEEQTASVPGQFLSRDPSGFADSVNLYAAMRHDPINGRDPTGRLRDDDPRWEDIKELRNSGPLPAGTVAIIQVTGAALECITAGGLWVIPDLTATKVAAIAVTAHCIDSWNAGFQTLATGSVKSTYTAKGGEIVCKAAGVGNTGQAICGAAADVLATGVPMALAAKTPQIVATATRIYSASALRGLV